MRILITGVAGFIGFSLAQNLLKKKYTIIGIDNLDNYYSYRLKKERLNILKEFKSFEFKKIDISNKNKLFNFIKNKNFDFVYHFAAQAGVRYSVINPKKYINTNIKGFRNLINALNKKNIKYIFYASSSSVYGDTKLFPVKENLKLKPKNLYAKTKIKNENDAKNYFKNYRKKLIGLRFFTVYGEWGRPDMLILKILSKINKNQKFELNNKGDHYRDFTYIGDVVKILLKLLKIKKFKHNIYNICSSKTVHVGNVVDKICKFYQYKKVVNIKKNKLDVYKTYGDNKRIVKLTKFNKFEKFSLGLAKTIKWYSGIGKKII